MILKAAKKMHRKSNYSNSENVSKKRGIITEYLVNKGGKDSWVVKEEALNLALEGRLHATIVHLKNGTIYLRPEYGSHAFTRVA